MLPVLAKLEAKAKSLGLTVKPAGKKVGKADVVKVLREHFLPLGGLRYTELTPMLCFPIWDMELPEQEKVWTSPNWVAQEKLNGCRLVLHFVKGVGTFAHSRTISLKTYRYQELTDQLLVRDFVPDFDATIDCEVMVEKAIDTRGYTPKGELTKSSLHSTTAILHLEPEAARRIQKDQDAPLQFKCFDITSWQTRDCRGTPLEGRLKRLDEFAEKIQTTPLRDWFSFPGHVREGKKEFFDRIIAAGGEGVILKNLRSTYEDSSSRRRDAWVKAKKRIEFDAFVTGFIRGERGTAWENLVGALTFSVNVEGGAKHEIANCSNLTLENRRKITVYDEATDTVSLLPQLYGKVAQVSGQDVSARSYRLSHATIDRWRPKNGPDAKRADDCVESLKDLKNAAEWVG
jgi:ATP-dependent DNA ligase